MELRTRKDRHDLMVDMISRGRSIDEICRATGWKPSTVADARRAMNMAPLSDFRTPSLPPVSFLDQPNDLTPADFYAGRAAQAAAGL